MKTILVPTDYSEAANNALRYAIEFTKFVRANIILFHAYHVPLPATEFPVVISSQGIEKENADRIKKLERKILKKVSDKIKIKSIIRQGFAADEILNLIKEKKIDMVIIGMKKTDKFTKLVGSTVMSLLKKTSCPVIVVPEKAKYREIKKIVYACDYKKINNHSILEPLWKLTKIYDAELMVLNVTSARVRPTTEQAIEGIQLNRLLGKVKHSYWFSEKNDVVRAIDDFVKKNRAVMIAMVCRKRLFPENLFHRSTTKRMAFQTHTPILFLHE